MHRTLATHVWLDMLFYMIILRVAHTVIVGTFMMNPQNPVASVLKVLKKTTLACALNVQITTEGAIITQMNVCPATKDVCVMIHIGNIPIVIIALRMIDHGAMLAKMGTIVMKNGVIHALLASVWIIKIAANHVHQDVNALMKGNVLLV